MYRREYPIRCKSCNEQLACYSEEYEELAREYGNEQALNMLEIMEPCSRYNMMNPMMTLTIKENRNLIEGLEDIDAIDKFSDNLSFQKCEYRAGNSNYIQSKKKEEIKIEKDSNKILPITNVTGKQIVQKQTYLSPINTNRTITRSSNVTTRVAPQLPKPRVSSNIMSPAKLISQSAMLESIKPEVEEAEEDLVKLNRSEPEKQLEFKYPTVVGIPTINSSGENTKIHISGKYYAEVLSGRTYIAR